MTVFKDMDDDHKIGALAIVCAFMLLITLTLTCDGPIGSYKTQCMNNFDTVEEIEACVKAVRDE